MNGELIDEVVSNIEIVCNSLYKQELQEGYRLLNELLPQIAVVASGLEKESDKENVLNILKDILQALENKDATLIADILQYDMTDELKKNREVNA